MTKVSASLLAAPPLALGQAIDALAQAGTDFLHIDVMDGWFVPNLSFGPDVVRGAKAYTQLPLDVHLMVQQPERYLEAFAKAGATFLTVHVEAVADVGDTLRQIRSLGMRPGLTLKPDTPVEALLPHLPLMDMALVMTVHPGFGGQKLIEACVDKVAALRAELQRIGHPCYIEVDGGVGPENAAHLVAKGADVLVMGTKLLGAEDPAGLVQQLHKL